MKTKTQSFGKPLCRVMMAVAIMLLSLQAMAYDFSYTHQGKTLYYKILAGGTNTLAVTYYSGTAAANNHVSGDVVIPSSVEHNNVTYSVTSIGSRAFNGCSGLTSVTIPNGVTYIEESAFAGCRSLTSVTIGNGVNSIGLRAFADCDSLSSIVSWATFPPQINRYMFPSANNCSLTVPCGSLGAYTASTWNELFNGRIEEGSSYRSLSCRHRFSLGAE